MHRKFFLSFVFGLATALSLHLVNGGSILAQRAETLKIYGASQGVSTRYIGAVEGSGNFDIEDLKDLGINTYRIYGGMNRWEAQDDDGRYGWPSIAQIKSDPKVINWDWWDRIMTEPPNGSDYWALGQKGEIWQGNARTIFSSLKQAGIRPVVTIRNTSKNWDPSWALQLNPPRTEEDWNEWWEHVFATVYWLNVRNDYQVDDWEIHNEPDNREQGWGGKQADYFELVKVAKDAIDFVYQTYLPNRTYYIHAPKTVTHSGWPFDTFKAIPTYFNTVNIHNYAQDISEYTRRVRNAMKGTALANAPLWIGEWGTYKKGYTEVPFAVNILQNLIRGCQPETYVYGSHIFSLYSWGKNGYQGLIDIDRKRTVSYYAFRMGIRALQGGRETFLVSNSNPNLMAIATRKGRQLYLLITNSGQEAYTVRTDFSDLTNSGTGSVWEFSAQVNDRIVKRVTLNQGLATLDIPANAAILVELQATR